MNKQTYKIAYLLSGIIIFSTTHFLHGAVDSVTGDSGSSQTGALTFSGGSSGAKFNSTTSTITQSFNFISLPVTSSTNGQILIADEPVFHKFPAGNQNLFVGGSSGNFSTSGNNNTSNGDSTLSSLTTGNFNTAIGFGSLNSLTDGGSNIAIGYQAGVNLPNGNNNILIGNLAGSSYGTSEIGNIIIGANTGVAEETLTIRIGDGFNQQNCYIDGIYTSPINFETGLEVFIDDQGKLGTVTNIVSRVNSTITELNNESHAILNLNPICAIPKNKANGNKRFALLANEAQRICPDLIIVDKKGKAAGVKHQDLTMLMLDQLKKQNARIQKLENKIQKLLNKVLP